MQKLKLVDLGPEHHGAQFTSPLPGHAVRRGGFRIYPLPNHRTHDEPGLHRHDVPEIFCIVQGEGDVEIDGEVVDEFTAGDAVVCEAGEDHHLISRGTDPLIFVWMHLEPVA
ncbi:MULTISPECIES: cupin domain-containing protein [Actinoplanes]|uniref:cupin domain-containing protein n=1 Tax=Actinoplanes TaxID=1865 RepID=UPI0005F2FB44|nr:MULTISPECIES: cupin domain-containing protein [Actinoplanes]GLY00006.1 hypothetical protein Acsp01_03850 [Actinoplanes sp. NBRC 101535]